MKKSYDSELQSKARQFRASTEWSWIEVEKEWHRRSKRKVVLRWLGVSGIAAAIIGTLLLFPGFPPTTDQSIFDDQVVSVHDLQVQEGAYFSATELREMYYRKD
jgi:hypothetical protein